MEQGGLWCFWVSDSQKGSSSGVYGGRCLCAADPAHFQKQIVYKYYFIDNACNAGYMTR